MDTLSSPTHFYTIPNELVSNIFLLCSRTSAKTFQDRYRFPVTLLLTSRHWHDVATTTPGLWTDIWIRRIGSLEHAQTRLQRSGALPLTMEVDIGDHVNDQLNLILPHVARWHSIQFTFPDITALLLTHSMLPPVAPQLDHLTLTATYTGRKRVFTQSENGKKTVSDHQFLRTFSGSANSKQIEYKHVDPNAGKHVVFRYVIYELNGPDTAS